MNDVARHIRTEHLPTLTQAPPRLLAGQKALVTGASSGIGRAVAIALGRAGADVLLNFTGPAGGAEEARDAIAGGGARAEIFAADVSDEAQVGAMFEHAVRSFGTLDIVVANAGIQMDAPFDAMSLQQWRRVLAVNLDGQFLCARAAVREFKRRGPRPDVSHALGKIICMSSVHEVIPWAGHPNYAASKGGVMLMMKSLAQEVAPLRIRVNAIAPGAIQTPINRGAWESPQAYAELMKLIPYGRIGQPEDVAQAAVWLASDLSDYVVGTTLFVDGGMCLYPGFATGG